MFLPPSPAELDTRQHGRAPGGLGRSELWAGRWHSSPVGDKLPDASSQRSSHSTARGGARGGARGSARGRSQDRCGSEASLVLQLTRLQPEGMPAGSVATTPQTRAAQGQCPGRIRGHLGSLSSACRRHSPHGPDLLKPRGKHTGSHAHTLACR